MTPDSSSPRHRLADLTRELSAVFFAFALFVSACGGDDQAALDGAGSGDTDDMTAMDDADSGAMGAGAMNMGDPGAQRADQVPDAALEVGSFELLDTRPQGFDATTGTAWLARHDAGTTVTIELSGLLPDTEYISHLHNDSCANNGGDHYQFEVGGSEDPPNEIHLAFTSDSDGIGFMTAENDQVAGADAVAIVVHPLELIDNKIACVDFEPASDSAG